MTGAKKLPGLRALARGVTLPEVLVAVAILALLLTAMIFWFRHASSSAAQVSQAFAFHIDFGHSADRLLESLIDANEVIKPKEGSSLPFLLVKNLVNHLQIFWLEKTDKPGEAPQRLVTYTDDLTGNYDPNRKKVLFGQVRDLSFTTVSPALVVVRMTLSERQERNLSAVFEVRLKNVEAIGR